MEALNIRPNLLNIKSLLTLTHRCPSALLHPSLHNYLNSTIFLPIHAAELHNDPHHPIIWIPLNQQGINYNLCAIETSLFFCWRVIGAYSRKVQHHLQDSRSELIITETDHKLWFRHRHQYMTLALWLWALQELNLDGVLYHMQNLDHLLLFV